MADTAIEPPPSYSSLAPSQPESEPSQPIPSLPERTGHHEYQLQHVNHHSLGLQIVHHSTVLYYIASYQSQNTPDLILYAGYDSKGPQLALAEFKTTPKTLKSTSAAKNTLRKATTGIQFAAPKEDSSRIRCFDLRFQIINRNYIGRRRVRVNLVRVG
ncbi:hypothetical protein HII31_11927 [Pseudocercospora fuligena]|uniref:Uncharacterized protein n=1 Tax=Pseudocercospora fuligena TaxID=685502 RepID=A0A8H6VH66_9PEZI|nr:hypothetical protein HII31_11927 [Pseudocercospora fuligena]